MPGEIQEERISMVDFGEPGHLASAVRSALQEAAMDRGKLTPDILQMPGASGRKYRLFINNLIAALPAPRYLEIGSFMGSTICSALFQNHIDAFAIDNWSQFGGPMSAFMENVARVKGPDAKLSFLEADFRAVDYSGIGKFDIYFFDGPHSEEDHRDAVTLAYPAFKDEFILIVDDWNWPQVRQGTSCGIKDTGILLRYAAEVRTSFDDTHPPYHGPNSAWHNGYFIAVCRKG